LNGDPIPPERKNYLGGVYERNHRIFGEACMNLMKSKVDVRQPFTESEYEKLRIAYIEMMRTIEHSERILIELGMDVSQFPTIKGTNSARGRYLFQREVESESSKSIEQAIALVHNIQPSSTTAIESLIAASSDPRKVVDDMVDNIDEETGISKIRLSTFDNPPLTEDEAPPSPVDVDDDIYHDTTPYTRR
jgi:hypothetical protein